MARSLVGLEAGNFGFFVFFCFLVFWFFDFLFFVFCFLVFYCFSVFFLNFFCWNLLFHNVHCFDDVPLFSSTLSSRSALQDQLFSQICLLLLSFCKLKLCGYTTCLASSSLQYVNWTYETHCNPVHALATVPMDPVNRSVSCSVHDILLYIA